MSTELVAGNRIAGIVPASFEDAFRIAGAAVRAGFRPLSTPYGKPDPTDDDQKAAATIIIMAGLEIGLPPTQAMEVIAMINGRRCIWGDGIPAILWSHGFELEEWSYGDGDDFTAYCTVTRPNGKKITRKFSVADAKQARLWDERATVPKYNGGTKPNDSPWYRYGKTRMLPMRARGWAARDGAADVLRGLRVAEEERDTPMRDITPATAPAPAALDLPDIPDEPDEAGSDQSAVLRDIERALNGKSADAVERDYATAIMSMDEDGRTAAIEMIQAAKAAA